MINHPSIINRVFTVAMLAGLVACGDDSTAPVDSGSPPDLPPLTSMTGDFSIFGNPDAQLGEAPSAARPIWLT